MQAGQEGQELQDLNKSSEQRPLLYRADAFGNSAVEGLQLSTNNASGAGQGRRSGDSTSDSDVEAGGSGWQQDWDTGSGSSTDYGEDGDGEGDGGAGTSSGGGHVQYDSNGRVKKMAQIWDGKQA